MSLGIFCTNCDTYAIAYYMGSDNIPVFLCNSCKAPFLWGQTNADVPLDPISRFDSAKDLLSDIGHWRDLDEDLLPYKIIAAAKATDLAEFLEENKILWWDDSHEKAIFKEVLDAIATHEIDPHVLATWLKEHDHG